MAVVGVLVAVLAVFSVSLHAIFARALWRQFDGQLASDAAAIAGMVEEDELAPWQFEYGSLPEFERPARPAYFQVWLSDGTVLARSPSLGTRDLSAPPHGGSAPSLTDVALPDGRPGRSIVVGLPARSEHPADVASSGQAPARHLVTVAVARGTEDVRRTLASTRAWLLALAVLVLIGASAAGLLAVSLGLRPARALADEIARLDVGRLGAPLAIAGLPLEIEPVAAKLNDVLARLAASFARERSFTADVSHELRTPLAALRTMLEVARSRPRPAQAYERTLDEAYLVVRQMHRLVEDLLMLARLDARLVDVRNEEVPLRELVSDGWQTVQEIADRRRVQFSNEIPPGSVVSSDHGKLRMIITNLLANAAEYTAPGGTIVVRAGDAATLVEVWDSGPPIPEDLLPRVFDRFSRADPARSSTLHCGIGLALVRGLSEPLGLATSAHNNADGSVAFRVATSSPSDPAQSSLGDRPRQAHEDRAPDHSDNKECGRCKEEPVDGKASGLRTEQV